MYSSRKLRLIFKKILRSVIYPLAGELMALYIKLIYHTSRIHVIMSPEVRDLMENNQPLIYAFWHGRLLMMPIINKSHHQVTVLSSKNEISILTDRCVQRFGIDTIYGSRHNPKKPHVDKGGRQALRGILQKLKNKNRVAITPDGPLGPRHKVHKGIISAAMLANVPILAITYTSSFGHTFNSWDAFFIPFPFGKLTFKYSAPFSIPRDTPSQDIEIYAKKLEKIMTQDLALIDKDQ